MLLLLFWATQPTDAVEPPAPIGTPATVRLTITAKTQIVMTVAEE